MQPALLSGYRFEDERLVDDMLREVAQERGTLPLLAFAMARLWEHRDRARGLLTRRAYEEIGGVAGALAQHAEATLETHWRRCVPRSCGRYSATWSRRQGPEPFRRGTSCCPPSPTSMSAAADVLDRLVEARLLTSFEAPSEEGTTSHRRLEIIHESLLAAWPRLARWRDQDAEGARLRDQLRQAARLWDERGRPLELLWTGPSFAEYLVWKSRYPGRLTALEQVVRRSDGSARRSPPPANAAGNRRCLCGTPDRASGRESALDAQSRVGSSRPCSKRNAPRPSSSSRWDRSRTRPTRPSPSHTPSRRSSALTRTRSGDSRSDSFGKDHWRLSSAKAATAAYRALLSARTANGWRTPGPIRACGGGMDRGR